MDMKKCNIHVLLQAAEFLERRERGTVIARSFSSFSFCTAVRVTSRVVHIHNELEKHRRAQLRQCLEQLKQQVPLSSDSVRNTTLNLLRHARLHIKKLQEQDERARQLKERLRWEQRDLRRRLEQLQGTTERVRSDSLGSTMCSDKSDSDRGDQASQPYTRASFPSCHTSLQ
uniref:Max dimerization protein 3 n=1 Tax=Scleropages formosus TaxID=113540 RepID=A0A8C9SMA4_SCLFO